MEKCKINLNAVLSILLCSFCYLNIEGYNKTESAIFMSFVIYLLFLLLLILFTYYCFVASKTKLYISVTEVLTKKSCKREDCLGTVRGNH